jgi:hypothetical protein
MRALIDLHQRSPQDTTWYGQYRQGSVGPGKATEDIARAAERTSTSPVAMTRAVAATSPQMPWTAGNKLYQSQPNIETADQFLKNGRDDAYERLLDELIESPSFGERMASMWLPLARYAEDQAHQVGSDTKFFYPNAYKYRKWVIDAFNRDLPYDEFVREQLAGDELPQPDDEAIIAELVAIRGIGRWTAEMFLIFYLMRPNVLPLDDVGLISGISQNYFSGESVSRSDAREVAAAWAPYCSVATWYIWRSLDPLPVLGTPSGPEQI